MARRKRRLGRDNISELFSTGIDANDGLVGRGLPSTRETRVTERVSIKMPFAAPRLDMGEYSPVSTNATEAEKNLQGWSA